MELGPNTTQNGTSEAPLEFTWLLIQGTGIEMKECL
jgi:hypothetical protein